MLLLGCGSTSRAQVRVTYIANEGVLISAGDDQVIIDALHKPYRPAYLPTPHEIEAQIIAAEKPFDNIDFILVSHVHGDHFDAQTVTTYLRKQPGPILFSSEQVKDSVSKYLVENSPVRARISTMRYVDGEKKSMTRDGVQVTIGKVAHGLARFNWVENLAHLIRINNHTLLHVGDPSFGRQDIERFLQGQGKIDVAILPSWFITEPEGREVIEKVIKPDDLIVVHVSPVEFQNVKRDAGKYYAGSTVFTESMESVTFE